MQKIMKILLKFDEIFSIWQNLAEEGLKERTEVGGGAGEAPREQPAGRLVAHVADAHARQRIAQQERHLEMKASSRARSTAIVRNCEITE